MVNQYTSTKVSAQLCIEIPCSSLISPSPDGIVLPMWPQKKELHDQLHMNGSAVLYLCFRICKKQVGGRTGLVVRALGSGSGDPGSILSRVGVLFP